MTNKILILGNGFDLALGLNTSYTKFWEEAYHYALNKRTSDLSKPIDRLADIVSNDKEKYGWVDLESSIKELAKNHLSYSGQLSKRESFQICRAYLKQFLSQVDYSKIQSPEFILNMFRDTKDLEIYTFNYTNLSVEASQLGIDLSKSTVHYVHGSLNGDNFILGCDEFEGISPNERFLCKTGDSEYRGTDMVRKLQSAEDVVIFGHSLGDSDRDYFTEYFKGLVSLRDSFSYNRSLTIITYDDYAMERIKANIASMGVRITDLYNSCFFSILRTDTDQHRKEICEKLKGSIRGTF